MADKRQRKKVLAAAAFKWNAYNIIEAMVERATDDTTLLVDEIIHSIFFLGWINDPQISPKYILCKDPERINALRGRYPRPFDLYSSQLPRRSPFSCVLDMVVHLKGRERENEIIGELQKIIRPLRRGILKKPLASTTICVSQKTEDSVRYYGVSMSTSGPDAGKVMIAASCLSSWWDSYVADAVMTYYPENVRNPDFDATIRLPESVRCETFNISQGTPMDPCRSCWNLFGLNTSDSREWVYGNCAEVESVSNLLKNEAEVKRQARPTSATCTEENRQRAEESVLAELENMLEIVEPPYYFYTPQIERGNY